MRSFYSLRMIAMLFPLCTVLLLPGCPPPVSPGVLYLQGISYGQGYIAKNRGEGYTLRKLYLDVITPESPGEFPRPAVLMIHGGSFDGGSRKDEDLVALADKMALAGYVCFLMDYRLMDDDPPAPAPYANDGLRSAAHAAVVDTKAALRFIRVNASQYSIDSTRIGILGESAGAIAGLGAALSDPYDYTSDGDDFPIPEGNYPGYDFKPAVMLDLWGTAREFEEEIDGNDPPVLIAHGILDTVIPATEAGFLASWLDEASVPYVLYLFWSEGHGAWDGEWDGKTIPELVIDFLDAWL